MKNRDFSEIIWKWGRWEIKVFFHEQTSPRIHYHQFHELVVVLDGAGTHRIGGEEYEIGRGDAFLVPPGEPHGYSGTHHLRLLNLLFFPDRLSIPLLDLAAMPGYQMFFVQEPEARTRFRLKHHLLLPNDAINQIVHHAETMMEMQRRNTPGNRFFSCLSLMRIFWMISTLSTRSSSAGKLPGILRVIEHLNANPEGSFKVADLARSAGMSLRSLQRSFTANTGYSPIEYLIRLRLRRAAGLLTTTQFDIGRIAAGCGFLDHNHFTRQFKKNYGVTPRDYRKFFAGTGEQNRTELLPLQ